MVMNRIVSFLPSATELLYELGVQDRLYGVTHECNFPEDAINKPRVIRSVFEPERMSSKEIDEKIIELVSNGKDIYEFCSDWVLNHETTQAIREAFKEYETQRPNQINQITT